MQVEPTGSWKWKTSTLRIGAWKTPYPDTALCGNRIPLVFFPLPFADDSDEVERPVRVCVCGEASGCEAVPGSSAHHRRSLRVVEDSCVTLR